MSVSNVLYVCMYFIVFENLPKMLTEISFHQFMVEFNRFYFIYLGLELTRDVSTSYLTYSSALTGLIQC